MTMHEINTAAETITNAADGDANIIFGATISPDLGDEIIITVVATGFDDTYFTKRAPESPVLSSVKESNHNKEDTEIANINMNLDDQTQSSNDMGELSGENPMPNIWSLDNESEKQDDASESSVNHQVDELEKPSFLRRFRKRNPHKSKDEK